MVAVLDRRELKYSLAGFVFMLVWFLWLRKVITPFLESAHPFMAMVVYNLGFLVGIYFIAGFLNGDHRVKTSLLFFMIFIGANLLMGPYLVSSEGMIQKDVDMWFAAADVGIAYFWMTVGISQGFMLWFFTYVVSGFLLMFLFPVLLSSPREVYQAIKS